jgi:TetR/AcrR family transcriptional regulator, transcriptional repressor for nem operon
MQGLIAPGCERHLQAQFIDRPECTGERRQTSDGKTSEGQMWCRIGVAMVRPRSKSREALVDIAMTVFWKNGFSETSIEDLVAATGVGRGAIYSDFDGKDDLFLGCLSAYRKKYVKPALNFLLSGDDGLLAIEKYFDFFISLHRRHGMPGPGCFLANAMIELAPHDPRVRDMVNQHLKELRSAFLSALQKVAVSGDGKLSKSELAEVAGFLATASQGLWSFARCSTDITQLEGFKAALIKLLKARLDHSNLC